MKTQKRSQSQEKGFAGFLLITFAICCICFLHKVVPGLFYAKNLVASLGGGAALYYIFGSRSQVSHLVALYAFYLSSCILFLPADLREPELSFLLILALSISFFYSFFWNEKRDLDPVFLIVFCGFLTRIGLDWSLSFLVELIVLFAFAFPWSHIKRNPVFLSLSLLLLLYLYLYFIGVHPGFRIGVVFLFGAAGAGGLLFLCLNKTEWEQGAGFMLYFVSNVILGFIMKRGAFPNITLIFIITVFLLTLFVYLVSKMQEESLSTVITGSKTLLRGLFFPFLYLLNEIFLDGAYFLWINSFVIHVLILLLFKFILKNEDQDPILENEEKG